MIPDSIKDFYSHDPGYAAARQLDCDLAVKYGLFEKVPLAKTKFRESGFTDIPSLPYNWFYNRINAAPDLAYVISPDARVPNYSTNLADALEIAIARGIASLPVTAKGEDGIKAMIKYITTV